MANKKLDEMIGEIEPGTPRIIRYHMVKYMLPTIAMYLALKENESTSDEAYNITLDIVQIAANRMKRKNRAIARLPFAYRLFMSLCKAIVSKQYPQEGWDIEWIRYDKREIHFNMTRCIYMDTSVKYKCPEVCPIFCANDDTSYAGYLPRIVFQRACTIGRGQDKCDFHFVNGKYHG